MNNSIDIKTLWKCGSQGAPLTPNACCGREWSTSYVFINFEYESNGLCKYGKGEICWHGVGENFIDFKKKIQDPRCRVNIDPK